MEASFTIRLTSLIASAKDANTTKTKAAPDPTDEELLLKLATGSREALSLIFSRYGRLVFSISAKILRDDAEADDLVQDVFIYLAKSAGNYDLQKSSARSWIVQMTYHRAIDRRRELQSRHFYSNVALVDGVEVMDNRAKRQNGSLALKDVVGNTTIEGLFDTLTEDQRNTLSLHFYEGYTFAEIAEKLGQSLGNVRHHYYRGLERLREQVFKGKLPGGNGQGRK